MIEIRQLTAQEYEDLNLPNEPFSMPGRIIPRLEDGTWSYRIEPFAQVQSMTFPDENYVFEELGKDSLIFGAYEDGVCLGLSNYQQAFFKYIYII